MVEYTILSRCPSNRGKIRNNYSDTVIHAIDWGVCSGIRIWGFADEDFNLIHTPSAECFTAFSHDLTIPVDEMTWGAIKEIYSTDD